MLNTPPYLEVLSAYPTAYKPLAVEFLGSAGGFSGAEFWRIKTSTGAYCLRKWPLEHPSADQLRQIHAVLKHVARHGVPLVPLPVRTAEGEGYLTRDGHLWELTPWLEGEADFGQSRSDVKRRAAMVVLAEFHMAAATFPYRGDSVGLSPGLLDRTDRLRRWLAGDLDRLGQSIDRTIWPDLEPRARRILRLVPNLAGSILVLLEYCSRQALPLQFCIGDIWQDHVLFKGDRVVGLVDFGSVRRDNVSTDVARLLGSMASDDTAAWKVGIEAYRSAGPLTDAELIATTAFDRSGVLLAGLHWLEWIYLQRRVFASPPSIIARLDKIICRLENLMATGRGRL